MLALHGALTWGNRPPGAQESTIESWGIEHMNGFLSFGFLWLKKICRRPFSASRHVTLMVCCVSCCSNWSRSTNAQTETEKHKRLAAVGQSSDQRACSYMPTCQQSSYPLPAFKMFNIIHCGMFMSPKAVHFYILVNYHVQNTKIEDAAHIMAASPKKTWPIVFLTSSSVTYLVKTRPKSKIINVGTP